MLSANARSHHKPVLTQDGRTAVKYALGGHHATRQRPEALLTHIFDLLSKHELTWYGRIEEASAPEFWEYLYLCENMRQPTLAGWLEWSQARIAQQGQWLICGNFVDLSYVWEVQTSDPELVQRFHAAFLAQPPDYHKARAAWEHSCQLSWAPRKARYADVDPVEYFREVEERARLRAEG